MKRAIALGGGGARGSYEAGVWKALREEEVGFDIVTGTSIGAINGALMVQGDFDDTYRLWQTIRVNDVMADGFDLDFSVEGIEAAIRQPAKMGTFLKRYARNKGADITPLATRLGDIIDEPRLRSSGVEFGLVTVAFPKLVSFQLTLADIPEGQLCDYLLASAACFPAFPVYRIGSEGYIDGGYGDNLPIGLAFAMGAEHTIAVDLEYARATHPKYTNHPLVTYIRPTHPICSMLSFRPEAMAYNLRLGYLDTKKALGILQGFQYAFANIDSETAARADVFVRMLTGWDARLDRGIAGPRRSSKEGLLTGCIRRDTRGKRLSSLDYYLRAAEICAALLGMDPLETYIPEKIANVLARKITLQAGSKIAEILYLLEQGGRNIDNLLHAAPLRPQEFCAALYLYVAHTSNGQEV